MLKDTKLIQCNIITVELYIKSIYSKPDVISLSNLGHFLSGNVSDSKKTDMRFFIVTNKISFELSFHVYLLLFHVPSVWYKQGKVFELEAFIALNSAENVNCDRGHAIFH
jgi:hypothetical protein